MEERELTPEEKRQKMKEEFKKDLMARKEFLQKLQALKQQKKLTDALESMAPEDDTDDWIRKLNEESGVSDAKFDMILEQHGVTLGEDTSTTEPQTAEDILKAIKAELGDIKKPDEPLDEQSSTEGPKKTLGDL